jgi:cytochrome c-type biogenesis protein CcmE
MHPVRRRRLLTLISIFTVLGCVVALVLYALRQNINVFYSPSELLLGKAPFNRTIRLGGMVLSGSLQRHEHLSVTFRVTDFKSNIPVTYRGILPDLFHEEKGVVVEGVWGNDGIFRAQTVLAKHDENYMPPQVKDMLQEKKT